MPIDHMSFDPPRADMEAIARAAVGYAIDFVEARSEAPAVDVDGAYDLAEALRAMPPEEPAEFGELLDVIARAAEKAFDTAGPGYLAYIPGGGLYAAAVADLLACVTNRFVNLAAPAPALVRLEANVTRWLCDLFSFPPEAQGVLTSGGSMANFSAVVTARTARLPEDFLDGTIYASEHVHHSIAKSARLAGFPPGAVRTVGTDDMLRVDVDDLRSRIRDDRRAGRRPFLVVGSAGTVNTGAVDPLDDVAEICVEENLWFHVDGAYGGFFQTTERGRRAFRGIDRADSVTLDPHKGLFLPYGTGSLIVRRGADLLAAHRGGASYLPAQSATDLPDFADYTPELSRDNRGLRVWVPLHLHGVAAFRRALDEKLDLARKVYDALVEVDGLDVPWEPELSIVAFKSRHGNDATDRMLEEINASRRVYLSGTELDGDRYLRIAILSHRTDEARIDEAIEIVAKAAASVA
ncbi:MAG TPA: aminotransferase class I/II-fold pyridoxal phosphate-dependent enzyme [Actinomycetota bacterium]|nr:aminotransferase class I/II-fold pyridoxal phosphate-dependent enzyme [Actinomycetota bacterium]